MQPTAMNPAGQWSEQAPQAQRVVQYTSVSVATDPPRDYIIWSLCCFLYSNPCCLGLAALIFSIKSRDRKMAGDVEGARHYGSTARCYNIISSVLVGILVLVFIITLITVTTKVHTWTKLLVPLC
ncbi:dispanin subfamily A member 2b-like [Pempheris klunzingeri]|uniref:dispanin subfamily A member 2b-like n=1 Tax=Pempheris klunzingeri TaxID=3127111 RepID=UPI003981166B